MIDINKQLINATTNASYFPVMLNENISLKGDFNKLSHRENNRRRILYHNIILR